MSTASPTTMIPLLPDSAPFSGAQRSWLNGFFAGLLGAPETGASPSPACEPQSPACASAFPTNSHPNPTDTTNTSTATSPGAATEESFPWHDPALPLDDRLQLADGKPFPRRLMAAMAQLDCGACGYLCKSYAQAIADGGESDLSLCQPGGKDTARKLKQLVADHTSNNGNGATNSGPAIACSSAPSAPTSLPTFNRKHPFPAPLLSNERLNKPGSAKDTRFISLDLNASGLSYKAGDSLGIFPQNCFEHVADILRLLGYHGGEPVAIHDGRELTVREALVSAYETAQPDHTMIQLLIRCATDSAHVADLKRLAGDQPVEGLVDEPRLIDVLARFPSVRPRPQEFIDALHKMRPRLYSISSSPRLYPDEVHLTVAVVRYEFAGRPRKGVASTYLAERVLPRQPVPAFVQPSHGFAPPADPDAPMIMVGPGTGIAPFRAFLQERKAQSAAGRSWLFFGDQREATDYLYHDELEQYQRDTTLTRLDTAFSRDGERKVYVQHRMIEQGRELWRWLQDGAHFYVCGDARRMAADVDRALRQIVAQHAGLPTDQAAAYVDHLKQQHRYQRDVY